ncbi:MAG: c-type cytochrome [candidate division KSB1 bacterium]|nr:c-type cytochrome [candidate division KSB1 bacterium]MDZ7368248.1 c-type cytochrome [candidate division KSB1 bacterium]MDZ7406770.1 c-type cytochrome [candidate division KSB1 bacterium]
MKKFLKILGGIVLALVVLMGAGLIYFMSSFPKAGPAPNLTIEPAPEKVARGKYLANHVTVCIDCHSTRNFDYYSGPLEPGTEGKGGAEFAEPIGTFYVPNITPAALGNWTDGEILHAFTAGVNKDGQALFPFMPYPIYSALSQDDAEAIVAYLRTLPPIQNEVKRSQLNFPLNFIVRTIPKPYEPQPRPATSDTLAYGKYLNTVAGCHFCHTPVDAQGQSLPGMDFAGGQEFRFPWGKVVRSANITPEQDTGIGAWDKEYFIGRFKEYLDSSASHIPTPQGDDNTVMPWTMYAGMTEEDLAAIFAYLQTVKPIRNEVIKHP